ncbi:MAG: hypothetical protein Q8Q59_03910 [Luteolibacter sp.]|jgi:hypothetical protein|nr:hypothetical protein [Luteolibacter sp.]
MKREIRNSLDDVLEAFACESNTGRATLEKYLRDFPEYAEALVDFAAEISWEVAPRKEPLSERELNMIEIGWRKHVEAAPKAVVDPFVVLTHVQLANVAKLLEVPRQVLTAFRDRTIVTASIPKRFAERLAAEIHSDVESLMAYLDTPPTLSVARSRKSDTKPKIAVCKTFDQVLTDAGVPAEDRKKLTSND